MPLELYGANTPSLSRFMVNEETILWRYLDIGKYLDFLSTRKMWFSRVAEMRKLDPYEGALTRLDRENISRIINASSVDELLHVFNMGFIEHMSNDLNKLKVVYLSQVVRPEKNVLTNLISCWHANHGESDAMWALYSKRSAGVSIKSSIKRLRKAFSSNQRVIWAAKVNYDEYDDLSAMSSGIFDSILIKRPAFRHENEIRLIFHNLEGYEAPEWTEESQVYRVDPNRIVPSGGYLDCELVELVDEVVLSPLMPPYVADAIRSVTTALFPSIEIRQSMLASSANFEVALPPELSIMWKNYQSTGRLD